MELIRKRAYARAGMVGNPSDGYHGRTISVSVRNFFAEVTLYEWDQIEVVPSQEDNSRFRSMRELVEDVQLHGYYGGIRLVKATIKRFADFCYREGYRPHERNFSVRYQSNIPRQVGLAGSSAIIVATLRCLMDFYHADIPREVQPSLALSVETEELRLAAGLQDRVIQVYEGLVFMDFAKEKMRSIGGQDCGVYEPLDPGLLPPLYLAYSTLQSKPHQQVHSNLRAQYDCGDPEVVGAMRHLAHLTEQAREAIQSRDAVRLGELIDENFNTRQRIAHIPAEYLAMVERARAVGATASFTGSGGAIIGTCADETTFCRLQTALEPIQCRVIRPKIMP